MRAYCRRLVNWAWFDRLIVGLIVFNAIVLGMETHPPLEQRFGVWMELCNRLILAMFVLEAIIKITAVAPRLRDYFGNGWNVFDFSVVLLSLMPATGDFAMIARLVRLLRVMRLISALPELRLIVATLVRSLPGLGHVVILLILIFYIYAVAGYHLLHEHDPVHWRSLGISLLTLFRVLTLEDWTDVMYAAMAMNPMMWIYFVSFVVIATFVVINLFIAVVINNLEEAKKDRQILGLGDAERAVVHQLLSMRDALDRLERRIESMQEAQTRVIDDR
ncbi:MAG: ion transporter [Gammaproteobacteria bacterium]|nr:ion transporter [Gammaproteobacteria bacterium]MDH3466003.1 ion transporter [Gammaproteobacteria bacterium]